MMDEVLRLYRLLTPRERALGGLAAGALVVAAVLQAAAVGSVFPFLSLITDPSLVEEGAFAWAFEAFGFTSYGTFLLATGAIVLGLVVSANVALTASHWLRLRFQWGVNHSLSTRLMDEYLSREYAFFLTRAPAELQRTVLNESRQVSDELVRPLSKLFGEGAVAVAMVVVLVVIDPVATLVVLGLIGVGFGVVYASVRGPLKRVGSVYEAANKDRFRVSEQAFGGIKTVKLARREGFFLERYEPASKAYSRAQAGRRILGELPRYALEILAFGSLLALVVLFLVLARPTHALVPFLGAVAFAGYRMMPAVNASIDAIAALRFTEPIVKDIEATLARQRREMGPHRNGEGLLEERAVDPLPFEEKIEFEGVGYTYPGASKPALEGLDLVIPRRSAVAFVGQTGAGKTTLVDVLLGLLEPTQGAMRVDGVPIRGGLVDRWQANIGYVPQEIYLTDATVEENIALGLPEDRIDGAAVKEAARAAQVHDVIVNELEEGYRTRVGERGVRLSGGQRQRIGIARALYHDPPVLVFDEATSDIDGATEALITDAIQRLHGEKTLITVAHRLSTIQNSDTIYLLDQGSIAARGTFDGLAESSPRFNAMLNEQVVPPGD